MKLSTRITFALFCCFILPVVFVSQTNNRQDSLITEAKHLNGAQKHAEALALMRPALETARQNVDWDAYFACAVEIAKSLNGLLQYDTACIFLEREIRFVSRSGKAEAPQTGNLWNNLAVNYANLEQYLSAFEAYRKAISIFEKNAVLGNAPAYAYKNIAQTYDRLDNATLAKQCYDASLRVDTAGTFRAEVYSSLANHYHYQDDEAAVMRNYERGIADPKLDTENKALLQSTGATAFIAAGRLGQAESMLLAAIDYFQQDRKTWEDNIISNLTLLAEVAVMQQNPQHAKQYFQRAEAEVKKYYKWKSREVAKLYIKIGEFYKNAERPENALQYYQKALIQAFPGFNNPDFHENPALSEALLESQAMYSAAAKAQILLKLAAQDKSPNELRLNAAHCFDLAFAVAARLRHSYGNDADKLAQSNNNRSIYQLAAMNLWELWRSTGETGHLEHLFALIEQSKAQTLADALQQQRALALSGIPDSLLKNEALLRGAASEATEAAESMEAGQDSAEVSKLKAHAFRCNKDYDEFIKSLGKRYPEFLQYTEADIPADIASIRKSLTNSSVLLSWFDTGDRYLSLRLHGKAITAVEIVRDSAFDRSLTAFISLLSDLNRQQSEPQAFFRTSHDLYLKLFPEDDPGQASSLIIIPDGLLCYLPFEVLLDATHEKGGFANAPYLFRNYALSYAWSAKLLTMTHTAGNRRGFVQFAPFAENARDQLPILSNSLEDVPQDLNRSVFKSEDASVQKFLLEAPENQVLHLSTHAHAGRDGEPGIEFFDRRLTLPEIYAQRLNASLVSLSACETGAGKFAGGEGVLSLARAFAYAGAQSMVASLWSVNDRATSALFTGFYRNLKLGMSKSAALREAKLAYLSSTESDARKAPYYWAAFTLTGKDGTLEIAGPWTTIWKWALAILLGSMIMFWGFRRRRPLAGKETVEL